MGILSPDSNLLELKDRRITTDGVDREIVVEIDETRRTRVF